MSILVNRDTKLLVQGITGHQGKYHTEQMILYGTKVVGGVTPGKGGQEVFGCLLCSAGQTRAGPSGWL